MVYRGIDRQHNITGNECVGVCVVAVMLRDGGPHCKEKSEEKQNGVEY